MAVASLRITDFRNFSAVALYPCLRGLNIIYGQNGSGKTNLLEAIHYLGLGRSFRCTSGTPLIRYETDKFSLFSQIRTDQERAVPLGMERAGNGVTHLRLAEKSLSSLTEIAYLLPIRLINAQSHDLIEAGPQARRKYLDWGLFYQSEQFFSCWRHFERALKQRNSILRDKSSKKELNAWTHELIKHGLRLDQHRREYVHALTPIITDTVATLLSLPELNLCYRAGWDEAMDYATALAQDEREAMSLGYTHLGPHRADLDITFNTITAKHILSRGQQKLLACAMILSQGLLLAKSMNKGLIYLVDDLPSELDLQSRKKLVSLLSQQNMQIFITTIEHETICDLVDLSTIPVKVFHVEQGQVAERG